MSSVGRPDTLTARSKTRRTTRSHAGYAAVPAPILDPDRPRRLELAARLGGIRALLDAASETESPWIAQVRLTAAHRELETLLGWHVTTDWPHMETP